MKFLQEGVAYAHLTLSPDSFANEASELSKCLENLGPEYQSFRITYLTGQSDLLLELRLRDLRLAFEIHYKTAATGANWLFAVPFDHPSLGQAFESDLALTYVLHLRVNRDIYRAAGAAADDEILRSIAAAAKGKMTASVMAGFGWSDVIVTGSFADIDAFLTFEEAVQQMRVQSAGGGTAFRRTLTLLGYDHRTDFGKASSMVISPVILIRCLPTHIGRAVAFLTAKVAGKWRAVSVDGKWDVLLFLDSDRGIPAREFVKHHYETVVLSGGMTEAGIERLETHLISVPVTTAVESAVPPAEPPRCSCASAVRTERTLLGDPNDPKSSLNILPQALVIAIRNVLNLFETASHESTNCCDIVPSLVRCETGLSRLLANHRALHKYMLDVAAIDTSATSSAARWNERVARARADIEEWCTYSERIVSQRTVGRFDEFLSQNERVVSYRGGVQKLLYLADSLLNSYAQRVFPEEDTAFMSLYDPNDIVLGHHVVGFVRIPARYLFILPLAIAHLWHEVGVHRYYSRYWMAFDERVRHRLAEFRRATGEQGDAPVEALIRDIADTYGDAVTLMKGFAGDFSRFAVSLSSTLFETNAFRAGPPSVKLNYLVALITRLYLVSEFQQRCAFVRRKLPGSPFAIDRIELDEWQPDLEMFILPRLRRIVDILNQELLVWPRYKDRVVITDAVIAGVVRALEQSTVKTFHRAFLTDYAWEQGSRSAAAPTQATMDAYKAIVEHGEVAGLRDDVDVNDLFLLLQQEMICSLRTKPDESVVAYEDTDSQYLRPVAALVRTAILTFYQRESNVRPINDDLKDLWNWRRPSSPIEHFELLEESGGGEG